MVSWPRLHAVAAASNLHRRAPVAPPQGTPVTDADLDRNLLYAVIALQDDLIDQAQFADVCAGWALRMNQPLAELLIERGWVTAEEGREVERKLQRKLKKHGGDACATLGAA